MYGFGKGTESVEPEKTGTKNRTAQAEVKQWGRLGDPSAARSLFPDAGEPMLCACLEGTMGAVYADREKDPETAAAVLGDFCFFGGKADAAAMQALSEAGKRAGMILVPDGAAWERLIEAVFGTRVRRSYRYALERSGEPLDPEWLAEQRNALPEGYELRQIDRSLYDYVKTQDWARDWVSNFADYEEYEAHGLGVAVLWQGIPVSGASSYAWCGHGLEIQIDTRADHRRKGLARICGAVFLQECEKRKKYPGWDAQNPASAKLAEQLGYQIIRKYPVYEIEEETGSSF